MDGKLKLNSGKNYTKLVEFKIHSKMWIINRIFKIIGNNIGEITVQILNEYII